jgi:hypothetical protein
MAAPFTLLTCPGCGANLQPPAPGATALACAFCGGTLVLNQRAPVEAPPPSTGSESPALAHARRDLATAVRSRDALEDQKIHILADGAIAQTGSGLLVVFLALTAGFLAVIGIVGFEVALTDKSMTDRAGYAILSVVILLMAVGVGGWLARTVGRRPRGANVGAALVGLAAFIIFLVGVASIADPKSTLERVLGVPVALAGLALAGGAWILVRLAGQARARRQADAARARAESLRDLEPKLADAERQVETATAQLRALGAADL